MDGALRAMPNWESNILGHTISWNILIPAVVVPGFAFTVYALYPFIERWVTGDKREHHILDRPRDHPTRTGLGVLALTFYVVLLIDGGNDILAYLFGLSINAITWTVRIAVIVLPPIAFVITRRICLGLQRRDRDKLLHGRETGIVVRRADGEMLEVHEPISRSERHFLLAREDQHALELGPAVDENGVSRPGRLAAKARAKVSNFYYGSHVDKPTPEEIEAAHHHDAELESATAEESVEHADRRADRQRRLRSAPSHAYPSCPNAARRSTRARSDNWSPTRHPRYSAEPCIHWSHGTFQSVMPLPGSSGRSELTYSTTSPRRLISNNQRAFSVLMPVHPWLTLSLPCEPTDQEPRARTLRCWLRASRT